MFSGKAEMGRDFYVKIVNADKEVTKEMMQDFLKRLTPGSGEASAGDAGDGPLPGLGQSSTGNQHADQGGPGDHGDLVGPSDHGGPSGLDGLGGQTH